jgi:hypothetical protein
MKILIATVAFPSMVIADWVTTLTRRFYKLNTYGA